MKCNLLVILYFQRVGLLANRLYLYKKKGVEETIFSFTPFHFVKASNVAKYNVTPCLNYCLRDGEIFLSHQAMNVEMSGKSSFPMFERTY